MAPYIVKRASNTWMDTMQRCEKKGEYRYVRGIRPRTMPTKVERGSWVHDLLAAYYRANSLENPNKAYQAAVDAHQRKVAEEWNPLFDEEKEELGDIPTEAGAIFDRYVERYEEQDKRWNRIVMVEQDLTVPVSWLPIPLGVKADVVVLDEHNWVWIYEHKIVGTIPDETERWLDAQGVRYILGMWELLIRKGIEVAGVGVVYDYVRDRVPAVPKLLKSGEALSKQKIDTDYETYMNAIKQHGFDPADYEKILNRIVKEGKPYFERWAVPKSKERLEVEKQNVQAIVNRHIEQKEHYPRTLDRKRCNWDCEFRDLCLQELEGGNIDSLLQDKFIVRGGKENAHTEPHGSTG